MTKYRIDKYTGHHRGGRVTYHLEICTQPVKDRIFHRLYHAYDMKIPIKVPGWKALEKFLLERLDATHVKELSFDPDDDPERKDRWRDRLYSWPILQDFRCYETSKKNHTRIATCEVSEETYRSVRPR